MENKDSEQGGWDGHSAWVTCDQVGERLVIDRIVLFKVGSAGGINCPGNSMGAFESEAEVKQAVLKEFPGVDIMIFDAAEVAAWNSDGTGARQSH